MPNQKPKAIKAWATIKVKRGKATIMTTDGARLEIFPFEDKGHAKACQIMKEGTRIIKVLIKPL